MQSIWSAENTNTFYFPNYLFIVSRINLNFGIIYIV